MPHYTPAAPLTGYDHIIAFQVASHLAGGDGHLAIRTMVEIRDAERRDDRNNAPALVRQITGCHVHELLMIQAGYIDGHYCPRLAARSA